MSCEICKVDFIEGINIKHERGKIHRRNILHKLMADYLHQPYYFSSPIISINNFFCTACSWNFHSLNDFQKHLEEEEHAKLSQQNPSTSTNNPLLIYRCNICYIRCYDLQSGEQHMIGWHHKRTENLFNLIFNIRESQCLVREPYVCDLCTLPCNDPKTYEIHVAGKKHKGFEHLVNNVINGKEQRIYLNEKKCGHFRDISLPSNRQFCILCNIGLGKAAEKHINGKNHKAKEAFIEKMYDRREKNFMPFYFDELVYCIFRLKQYPHYCKKCNIWLHKYGLYKKHRKHKKKKELLRRKEFEAHKKKRCHRCEVMHAITCIVD